MDKKLIHLELFGLLFVAAGAYFSRRLYALTDGGLTGILFGAVNGSVWESCKTLLLPYLLWALLEALIIRVRVRRFAAAKTAALYLLGFLYIFARMLSDDIPAAVLGIVAAFAVSYALYRSPLKLEGLFAPSVSLLFLFLALYFSLTPFPPRFAVFRDPSTGMYGIMPKHLDFGAIALEKAQYIV